MPLYFFINGKIKDRTKKKVKNYTHSHNICQDVGRKSSITVIHRRTKCYFMNNSISFFGQFNKKSYIVKLFINT